MTRNTILSCLTSILLTAFAPLRTAHAQHTIDISSPACAMTLHDAVRQARELRRLNAPEAKHGITIELGNRTFIIHKPLFLRPEDSGTAAAPTLIRGGTLSGTVQLSGWKKEGKLWACEPPKVGNRIVYTRQLWVNGRKALRAQQFPTGQMERIVDFDKTNRTITIPTPSIDLSHAAQLEMMVHQRWAIAILRVKEMKKQGENTVVSFHDPESELEFTHPWPQPVIGSERGNSSFCLMNALDLLDEPGEWYQEYPSGRIYYMPRDGESMETMQAQVPHLENLVMVQGSEGRPVEHVTFKGTTFEGAAWQRPSYEGHVTLQGGFRMIDAYKLHEPGLFHNKNLENQAWIARPEAAVTVRKANAITFDGCRFKHLAATGLDLEHHVSRSTVTGCTFEDIGGTALMAGYFGEQAWETHIPYQGENICDSIIIRGNTIHDATNEDWGAVGIAAGYVSRTMIDNNHVSHLNYSGICLGWGWTALHSGMHDNHITNNKVYDYARQLYDTGGIYTLSNQPRSTITGNDISAPYPAPYATNQRAFCIYFDEATDGFTVENNRMVKDSYGYNKTGPAMIVR